LGLVHYFLKEEYLKCCEQLLEMEELPMRGVIVGFLICQTPEFLLADHQSCKVELVSD
jgi:hypothetical protein